MTLTANATNRPWELAPMGGLCRNDLKTISFSKRKREAPAAGRYGATPVPSKAGIISSVADSGDW